MNTFPTAFYIPVFLITIPKIAQVFYFTTALIFGELFFRRMHANKNIEQENVSLFPDVEFFTILNLRVIGQVLGQGVYFQKNISILSQL
jgi:hypothetical protein